jgi:predicted phage terminase large subunit-like protein
MILTDDDIKRLQVAKTKCLTSLLFHTRYFFKSEYNKKFVIGDHHQIICDALERVLRGELKRLIINIAPRYGKTELAVKSLIGHGLSLNPAAKFIHLSYSDDLALDNSEHVKDLVQSEAYQALFPDVQLSKDSKAKNKWYTTAGGGVLARAAGGSVTGFGAGLVDDPDAEKRDADEMDADIEKFMTEMLGVNMERRKPSVLDRKFNFGGCVIIDDPIKPEDADQDTIRNRVNSRFDSTIRNRVNSRDTPIIVIMQRLHPDDLAGYLQRDDEADKWEVISLPCINKPGNKYGLVPGEALWPFKHTVDELRALEHANELVYGRQYDQNPSPKSGLLFPLSELQFADFENTPGLDDPDYTAVLVDPANEGGDDFAAAPFKLLGQKIYVDLMLYNTDGTDVNEPAVRDMILNLEKNGTHASFVGVESVFGWRETAKRIRQDLEDHGYEYEFRMLKQILNKHTRIVNRASFIRNHFVFRHDYKKYPQYEKFIRNLTTYLKIQEPGRMNKHDDAPDLCEMAAAFYEKTFPHLWAMNLKK